MLCVSHLRKPSIDSNPKVLIFLILKSSKNPLVLGKPIWLTYTQFFILKFSNIQKNYKK